MTNIASCLTTEAAAQRLAEALDEDGLLSGLATGISEVAPGRWKVEVYLEDRPDRHIRASFDRALQRARTGAASSFVFNKLPETDWVAKSLEGLSPVRAGRFLVHGRHDRGRRRPNDLAIEIEANLAFGTGHHGTTAGCLRAIDELAKSRKIVSALDLGTGSGVLAIAIAKRFHVPVVASDIDPVAVAIARNNADANGVGSLVGTVLAAGASKQTVVGRARYDVVVANILAGPLVKLSCSIRARLAGGGTLILSGLLPDQRARIVAAYRRQGLRLIRASVLDGWLTMVFQAPNRKGGAFAPPPGIRRIPR